MIQPQQKLLELTNLVKETRTAQKTYFRERSPRTLKQAKALESKLDRFVANINQVEFKFDEEL